MTWISSLRDRLRFRRELKKPTITLKGLELLREAQRMVDTNQSNKERLYNMSMGELREMIHDLPDDITVEEFFELDSHF